MEKQQSKKPLIRFPEFKDAWENKKLNELLSEARNRNTDLKYSKNEVLSVSREWGIVNQIEHLGRSYAGVSVHQYHVVDNGDIVYTKSPLKENPYGIIKLNRGKAGIVSTLYAVYKVKENTSGEFLDQYFSLVANTNRYLRPLVKKGAKNDMKISNSYVLHDKIFVPTFEEQKRIASFFTDIDQKISLLKQKKNLLELYKKGAVQKIFSKDIRFKNSNGLGFPQWKKTSLANFLIPTLREVNKPNVPYLAIGVRSHFKGTFQKVNTPPNENQMDSLFSVKEGDLLLNITFAWEGAVAIAKKEDNNGLVSHRFPTYTFKEDITNYNFFQYCFFQKRFQHELNMISPGGAGRNKVLNKNDFLKITCEIPCLNEQSKIASFLNSIDQRLETCKFQLSSMQQYKKGLLQKMFC